jgi:hypothetical protein
MSVSRLRLLRFHMAVVAAALALGAAVAPTSASAATCGTAHATATDLGAQQFRWSGSAVGMCTSWTYSWHIGLGMQRGGDCDAHDKTNFGGTTYTSTPTYTNYCDAAVFGVYGCADFRLHHGTSNSSPLVDEAVGCTARAPAIASQIPGLLSPDVTGTPAEQTQAPTAAAPAG